MKLDWKQMHLYCTFIFGISNARILDLTSKKQNLPMCKYKIRVKVMLPMFVTTMAKYGALTIKKGTGDGLTKWAEHGHTRALLL